MSAKLETIGISKQYGKTTALEPTDLTIKNGEFLTLLGPSGSGKTTLLQMISGLVSPTTGRIEIDGQDVTHVDAGKRGIGMVFQSYALFPHLTARENVAYGLRMRRHSRVEINAAVDAAFDMVRMREYAHRFPKELSGGQQQRIALARCFAYRPSIILLDEPLGALDKKLRGHMQLEIRRLHKELGATFIYVTHDQDEALTLSDRICLMNQARIEQLGTPTDLYDRPTSRFSATFIGNSNLIEGTVTGASSFSSQPTLKTAGGNLPIPPQSAPSEGAKRCILLRPETACLVEPRTGFLDGKITDLVFFGTDTRVEMTLQDTSRIFIRCSRDQTPVKGDVVGVRWDPRRTTLLDL